ncbi:MULTISPECIES: sensor domain-containing diguanylate cyclase [unclassified Pseudoalteromonas]|uniref:sensor domain-containing diguanylate cyclase n=1 Tax=unclassified Pseudoalteromonas TaxID=194690 RepID=UPI0020978761|nr:sensor domain-containing diguanylate cyclase [Pseudoalteromonas sp. XMcav2-N]MCO7187437.1 diguanylate cyclase [Pseudoalteromonas sp. XMcav2-N]
MREPLPSMSLVKRLTQLNLSVMASSMLLVFSLTSILLWFVVRDRQAEAAEINLAQLAHNVVPMLVFNDVDTATKELTLVGIKKDVLFVSLRKTSGEVFSEYADPSFVPASALYRQIGSEPQREYEGVRMRLYYPVAIKGKVEGDLIMVIDLTSMMYWYLHLVLMLALLIAALFTVSAFLLSRVQRKALTPLIALSELAQRVSSEHNFQLRANVIRDDEIGILTRSFNELLKRVDISQAELRQQLEQEQAQGQQLKQMVRTDALTNLPNRVALNQMLKEITCEACMPRPLSCLMFIDLDNFKFVNDNYGHDAGDETLIEVGKRISAMIRSDDLLCRLGGDEFALLLPSIESTENAEKLAARIVTIINRPIVIKDTVMPIGISIGLAYTPLDASAPMDLLNCADDAMYAAKRAGKNNFKVFSKQASV